jgi:hypothetical protein
MERARAHEPIQKDEPVEVVDFVQEGASFKTVSLDDLSLPLAIERAHHDPTCTCDIACEVGHAHATLTLGHEICGFEKYGIEHDELPMTRERLFVPRHIDDKRTPQVAYLGSREADASRGGAHRVNKVCRQKTSRRVDAPDRLGGAAQIEFAEAKDAPYRHGCLLPTVRSEQLGVNWADSAGDTEVHRGLSKSLR